MSWDFLLNKKMDRVNKNQKNELDYMEKKPLSSDLTYLTKKEGANDKRKR